MTLDPLAYDFSWSATRGLAARDGERIVAARTLRFGSVEEPWRRAGLPVVAYGSLGLSRRQAEWVLKAFGMSRSRSCPQRPSVSKLCGVN
jgi:hypothetical protein